MATRFQVTIDCAQPEVLTRFWATALGYRVEDPPAGFDDVDDLLAQRRRARGRAGPG